MKKFNIFIFVFFLIFTKSFAETVKKLEVNGNNRVSDETIKIYGEIELNKDYNEIQLDEILKNL